MEYIFYAIADVAYPPDLITSNVCVYQNLPGQPPIVVGYINDTLECGELRNTRITYADGSLHFSEDYDAIIMRENYFQNQSGEFALSLESISGHQCLRDGTDLYTIHIENDPHSQFTRISLSKVGSGNDFLPPYARITRTLIQENRLEYEIRTEDLPNTPLLMAMVSLPFTTGAMMHFGSHLTP